MAQVNSIIRVKNADGTYTTIMPETLVGNVKDDHGNTLTEIVAGLADKDHVHNYVSDVPSTVAVGGVEKGFTTAGLALDEMIFKLLHPYVKPTISYSCSPNGGVYEIGSTVDTVNVNATGNRQSDIIQNVKIYKNGTAVVTKDWNQAGNCAASYADTGITANTTYKADVSDGKNTVPSGTTTFTFVRPAYVGVMAASAVEAGITSDNVKAMTKKVMSPAVINHSFTLTDAHMCIALPAGWEISSIIDPNTFDITNSFVKSVVPVTCLDGQVVNYNVYTSGLTTQSAFSLKFNKK